LKWKAAQDQLGQYDHERFASRNVCSLKPLFTRVKMTVRLPQYLQTNLC